MPGAALLLRRPRVILGRRLGDARFHKKRVGSHNLVVRRSRGHAVHLGGSGTVRHRPNLARVRTRRVHYRPCFASRRGLRTARETAAGGVGQVGTIDSFGLNLSRDTRVPLEACELLHKSSDSSFHSIVALSPMRLCCRQAELASYRIHDAGWSEQVRRRHGLQGQHTR